MTEQSIDPVFAAALRDELVALARKPSWRRHLSRRLGVAVGAGVILAGGGGAAYAAATGAFAPPGQSVDAAVVTSVTAAHTGTATVQLGRRPAGANDVSLSLTCLSAGTFEFPGGELRCTDADARGPANPASITVAAPTNDQITVHASPKGSWLLQATYVHHTTTPLGVNAHGETYGVINSNAVVNNRNAIPDLIAVDNGHVAGYIKATDDNCASGDDTVKNPSDAVAWDKLTANTNIAIPIYKSDGTTVVGTFVIGNAHGPDARTVPLKDLGLACGA